ncbi:MAG: hypothetical protein NWQ19_07415, partial [Nonlabens sp.]|nr:hypothetical protein [Nonlabens sp.]
MKKITLLMFSLLLGATTYAQDTCATALPISLTSGNMVGTINGTAITQNCADTSTNLGTAAEWYQFTATATGTLNLNSDIPGNASDDTRVSIYTGTCGALTCVGGNDDISASNYLTDVTINVTSGTVYTIAWDNRWNPASFTFNATFTPVACPSPTNLGITDFTTTTSTIAWDAVGDYEVEYGEFPYTQGNVVGGTVVNVTGTNTYQLTGLTPGVAYNVFVRQNCGTDGFSTATEGFAGTSPSPMITFPFSEDLEPAPNQALLLNLGLSFFSNTNNWSFGQDNLTDGNTANDFASNGISYVFSNNTFAATDADATIYFGPYNLTVGSTYTLSVDQRNTSAASATTPNKDIELLAAATNDGTSNTVLATFDDMINVTHQLRTGNFTPAASGSFYFGVRDKSNVLAGVAAG